MHLQVMSFGWGQAIVSAAFGIIAAMACRRIAVRYQLVRWPWMVFGLVLNVYGVVLMAAYVRVRFRRARRSGIA